MEKKHHRIEAVSMEDDQQLGGAIGYICWYFHKRGLRAIGDSATMIIPAMEAGFDPDVLEPIGEFEIKITKVGE